MRILLGSPVNQSPAILAEFLASIRRLDCDGISLSCVFIDDNESPESSRLLQSFDTGYETHVVRSQRSSTTEAYRKDDNSHWWRESLIWRVAGLKNFIIESAIDANFDFLFLVDSDLVLSPHLLKCLVAADKDIISEVFWTAWTPADNPLPQVWLSGQYELAQRSRNEQLSPEETTARIQNFIRTLYQPGQTRVGGLGACTLIRRNALEKGVRFSEIDNLGYTGEDRHFCIRARALGFELWADTHHPPLHLYRESDLAKVESYIAYEATNRWIHPRITLSMLVRNESGRYLEEALLAHRELIHNAVIIDDASTDDTISIVERCLEGIPLRLIRNRESGFHNEHTVRKQQWNETTAIGPDWILNLDADQILDVDAKFHLREIINQKQSRFVGFPLYDMWNSTHYREDALWNAHQRPWGTLFRYTPFFNYKWNETAQHCGHFPCNLIFHGLCQSQLRIKHMGWAKESDRQLKYDRYSKLDPDGIFGSLSQYASILDKNPRLLPW